MSDVYSDDYGSVAGPDRDRLVPESLRRLAGAALFLVLVAAMALWAYRLGTRDAAEVPIIRAMEGPARIQPEDPGGLRAAHQGLEVNSVLAGDPAPAPAAVAPLAPPPAVLAEEDGPQGELVLDAPAAMDEAALEAGDDLRMPPQDEPMAEDVAEPDPSVDAEAAAVLAAVLGETRRRGGHRSGTGRSGGAATLAAAGQPDRGPRRRRRPQPLPHRPHPPRRPRRRQPPGPPRRPRHHGARRTRAGLGPARGELGADRARAWCSSAPTTTRR
jgi:hypothetical protein